MSALILSFKLSAAICQTSPCVFFYLSVSKSSELFLIVLSGPITEQES